MTSETERRKSVTVIDRESLIQTLSKINQALVSTSVFANALRMALEITSQSLRSSCSLIALLDEHTNEIKAAAAYGLSTTEQRGLKPAGRKLIERILRTDVQTQNALSTIHTNGQILTVHLLSADESLGALSVELPADFDRDEASEFLSVASAMFVQAIKNNRRLEAATRQMLDSDADLRATLSARYDFSRIIGNSGPMRQVYEQIAQAAPTNMTVLIQGESGTGKEIIAHALHINSPRSAKPFIKVNCGALNESLIEAELFGHERGAFTDAFQRKPGRFELAEGGTIFLDEIGELPISSQVKLLRILQTRDYVRLGGSESLKADVRVIAATNRKLENEVNEGRFRQDLYYRLNVFTILVPALRERRDDIAALAEHFLEKYATAHNKPIKRLSSQALNLLCQYDWPGNVRELENVIERAVIVCDNSLIHHYNLPADLQTLHSSSPIVNEGLFAAVEAYEKELICAALQSARGNRTHAAQLLKISPRVLGYKIEKYKIVCEDFRD